MEAVLDYPLLMMGGAAVMGLVGKQMGGFLGTALFRIGALIMSLGLLMAILMYTK